jgi:hypothetical protein
LASHTLFCQVVVLGIKILYTEQLIRKSTARETRALVRQFRTARNAGQGAMFEPGDSDPSLEEAPRETTYLIAEQDRAIGAAGARQGVRLSRLFARHGA